MRDWRKAGVLGAFLVLSACAEDDGLSDEDAWARRHAEAICAAEHDRGCDCETRFSSMATCVENRHDEIRRLQRMAIADGNVFDLDCADEHIALIDGTDCGDLSAFLDAGDYVTCTIYSGDRQLGETCSGYSWAGLYSADRVLGQWMGDCEPGLMCVSGRCVTHDMPYFLLEADAPCFDRDELMQLGVCGAEQTCNFTSGFCVAPAAEGGSCADGTPCALETWCDRGECVARKPDGEPCSEQYECMNDCVEGVCAPWSTEDRPAACHADVF
jgi:hypothetical protein